MSARRQNELQEGVESFETMVVRENLDWWVRFQTQCTLDNAARRVLVVFSESYGPAITTGARCTTRAMQIRL